MKEWEYNHGQWHEIADPVAEIGDTDFDAWLERVGYEHDRAHGDERDCRDALVLYRARPDTPISARYPFLVVVELGASFFDYVFLPDVPSALMFLREFAPLAHQQSATEFAILLEDTLVKAFHAWHGHHPDEDCQACDPAAVRARAVRRAEKAQARIAKAVGG